MQPIPNFTDYPNQPLIPLGRRLAAEAREAAAVRPAEDIPKPGKGDLSVSALVLPKGDASVGAGYVQSPGGLYVPGDGSSSPSGLYVPAPSRLVAPSKAVTEDLRAGNVLDQAREGYDLVAATEGKAAADLRYAKELELIDSVAADERHQQVVDDFMAGRITTGR